MGVPHIPGLDIAGVVHDAGSGPDPRFPVGTRVVWHQDLRCPGGLAEFRRGGESLSGAPPIRNRCVSEALQEPRRR